ncbi:hypothetical protein GCM10009800_44930 [Nocardiopsis rhodophaea]
MIETTVYASPEVLEAELRDLRGIDWSDVWKGPPLPTSQEFRPWCERYGWKNLTIERNLEVRTRHGVLLEFAASGDWDPVNAVSMSVWHARTSNPDEKNEVITNAVNAWSDCVRSVSQVMGAPSWAGAAGASDFPFPPYEDVWERPVSARGNPFLMAYWKPSDPSKGHPYIILSQSVARKTWEQQRGAAASISLEFMPPAPRRGSA